MNQSNIVNLNVYYDDNDMFIDRHMLKPLRINPISDTNSDYYKISIYELDEICNADRGSLIIVPRFLKLKDKEKENTAGKVESAYLKDIIKLQDELTDYLSLSFYTFLNNHLDYDPRKLSRILSDTCHNFYENEQKDIHFLSDDEIYNIED